MIRLWRMGLIVMLALAGASPAAARDPGTMTGAEISALQRRLTEAGCYAGPLDGIASAATAEAVKACPDQDPVLRLETGMHTAKINQIGVNEACTLLATASDDKTVRLWSLPEGTLKRTIRLPIGSGDAGKVYAVALSPDDRTVAAGGWDAAKDKGKGDGLYLTDTTSGTTRRIGDFEEVIDTIAFSADGARIAVGLGGAGLRVLDAATGRERLADRRYGDHDIYGAAFAGDGSLYTASDDGFVRRYGPDLTLAAKVKAPDGKNPFAVAIDPAGRRLAVGYTDTRAVSILDAATLQPLARAQTSDLTNGDLSKVAWSADGQRLIAGGRAQDASGRSFLRRFTPGGERVGPDVPVSDSTVFDLKPCGGNIAFAADDPRFGLMSPAGGVRVLQGPVTADMRGKLGTALTVSANGAAVRFGLGSREQRPVLFDLLAGTLTEAPGVPAGFTSAITAGLPVGNWQNSTDPTFGGKLIGLEQYEYSQSLAVRPDRAGFVLGTEWSLRAFDAAGQERWNRPVPGTAWGVDLAAEGRIVVTAHADGTIRWSRWSDGADLLALFVHAPSKRWVAWTPSGYYMASPGAEDLIGWHVNRGWSQQADFFPASRFRDSFNRPDIVQRVLQTLDEAQAVTAANAAAHKRTEPAGTDTIARNLPPVVTLTGPAPGSTFTGREVTLDYAIRSPSGRTIDGLDVLIDGRPAADSRGVGRSDIPAEGTPGHVTVAVPPRSVELALIAHAGSLTSEPARIRLVYAGGTDDPLKPKLYVLAIGVADYVDPDFKLGLAGKDAIDFGAAFKAQEGGLYSAVTVKPLIDRDATHDTVLEGLEWLERQVTSRDIGIVFLAGHGLVDEGGRFWYLPSDATPSRIRTRGVSKEDILATLGRLSGKAVLFLDTCHAASANGAVTRGAVDINSVVNDFATSENGVVTFASSMGRELSQERVDWGNGAFTKAVVEGIALGKAALLAGGEITLSELDAYVAERVKQLTAGRQHPVMTRPPTITNFPIALVVAHPTSVTQDAK